MVVFFVYVTRMYFCVCGRVSTLLGTINTSICVFVCLSACLPVCLPSSRAQSLSGLRVSLPFVHVWFRFKNKLCVCYHDRRPCFVFTSFYYLVYLYIVFFIFSGWFVAVDVHRCVDEEGCPGEDQGGGYGRLHHAHHGVRVLDDLRDHRDCPRHSTGMYHIYMHHMYDTAVPTRAGPGGVPWFRFLFRRCGVGFGRDVRG